ncbi:S-adenosyl-L-methionine-dependent methyltransferase [Mycena kentingensis (nom. inval.)]|nr:S-adenosyl-L-methionine-dependent methyltransferase [Mycena kentingensis (nom. inval.)]
MIPRTPFAKNPNRLHLNKASFIFFEPQRLRDASKRRVSLDTPIAVGVIIKLGAYETRAEVAAFYDAAEDITAAIETLVFDNVVKPIAESQVQIDGDGFLLIGEKTNEADIEGLEEPLELSWADQDVQQAKEGWRFCFRTAEENAN